MHVMTQEQGRLSAYLAEEEDVEEELVADDDETLRSLAAIFKYTILTILTSNRKTSLRPGRRRRLRAAVLTLELRFG